MSRPCGLTEPAKPAALLLSTVGVLVTTTGPFPAISAESVTVSEFATLSMSSIVTLIVNVPAAP